MIEQITDNGFLFNRAHSPEMGAVWRLVHDGTDVRMLEETSGTTDSIHTIQDFESRNEALEYIADMNLSYIDPEAEPEPPESNE